MTSKKFPYVDGSEHNFARGKTPSESQTEVESISRSELTRKEVLDDPSDPSVTPIEPRCRKSGGTFATEAELLEHSKTCKGGHNPPPRSHRH